MSAPLFPDDVLFAQRLMSCCGVYQGALHGIFDAGTNSAEVEFENQANAIATAEGSFDSRSERNIRTLQLKAQTLARRSLKALHSAGHDARVISGTRSYAEQNALFKQGRFGNPGPIVTNARGGQSWHNFGLAWDIGLFVGGAYQTNDSLYRQVSSIAKVAGTEWGGDWKSLKDNPHYQVATGNQAVSGARTVFEAGGR